jgi:hypothetical protein
MDGLRRNTKVTAWMPAAREPNRSPSLNAVASDFCPNQDSTKHRRARWAQPSLKPLDIDADDLEQRALGKCRRAVGVSLCPLCGRERQEQRRYSHERRRRREHPVPERHRLDRDPFSLRSSATTPRVRAARRRRLWLTRRLHSNWLLQSFSTTSSALAAGLGGHVEERRRKTRGKSGRYQQRSAKSGRKWCARPGSNLVGAPPHQKQIRLLPPSRDSDASKASNVGELRDRASAIPAIANWIVFRTIHSAASPLTKRSPRGAANTAAHQQC